ncbi:cyclin-dependent kinase 19-like isoform X1, partial [Tachysurus ichikawai]
KDEKEYALKQIEGTGISMSACREIASNAPVPYCISSRFLATIKTQMTFVDSSKHEAPLFCGAITDACACSQ